MAYEHEDGSFSLFRNDRKSKDGDPDYTGSGKDTAGTDVYVNGWINETKDGRKYLKVKLKLKVEKAPPSILSAAEITGDEIPF